MEEVKPPEASTSSLVSVQLFQSQEREQGGSWGGQIMVGEGFKAVLARSMKVMIMIVMKM